MRQVTSETKRSDVLPCLLIPVLSGRLILPSVTMAELIDYQTPVACPHTSDWLLGRMEWRGTMIPVILYEHFCGQTMSAPGRNLRIVVVNTPGGNDAALKFFGVVVQGIPGLIKLEEAAIKEDSDCHLLKGQKLAVSLASGHAIVPDLEAIESALLNESWQ